MNVGLDNECSLTPNRKNEAMASVEEIYYEPTDILVVNDHILI